MVRSQVYPRNALIIWSPVIVIATVLTCFVTGDGAYSSMEICAMEQVEVSCPPRDWAIQNNEYHSLLWAVSDPADGPNTKHEYVLHCGENPVNCKRYNLTERFRNRIIVRNPVGGKLYLKHLNMHVRLSYTCKVELKDNKPPLAYQVNVASSVYCLTGRAGQDLNLCPQEFGITSPSKELIEDIWWSTVQADGRKEPFLHCKYKSCQALNNSFPDYLTRRLEPNGTSLIFRKVGQNDRGLEFQRRIEPNTMKSGAKPMPQFYTVKIKNILPSDLNTTVTSPSSTTTKYSNTTQDHGTKPSACDRVSVSVTVLVSLVMALYIT